MTDTKKLFKNLSIAETLSKAIDRCPKSQKEIAREAGFNKPNIITMLKQGLTPLPINRVGPLARAVGLDPAFLLRLTMKEYNPETWTAIESNLNTLVLTENERQLIKKWRDLTEDNDPSATLLDNAEVVGVIGVFVPVRIRKAKLRKRE